jgi:hypothetical protein
VIVPRGKPKQKRELVVPDDLTAALKKREKALATFEQFSPSHKREYEDWITEAKRAETRKPVFQDCVAESRLGDEELNLEAGRSALHEAELLGYADRELLFGEVEAMRWLQARQGSK